MTRLIDLWMWPFASPPGFDSNPSRRACISSLARGRDRIGSMAASLYCGVGGDTTCKESLDSLARRLFDLRLCGGHEDAPSRRKSRTRSDNNRAPFLRRLTRLSTSRQILCGRGASRFQFSPNSDGSKTPVADRDGQRIRQWSPRTLFHTRGKGVFLSASTTCNSSLMITRRDGIIIRLG